MTETRIVTTKNLDLTDYHAFSQWFNDGYNFHCSVYFTSGSSAYVRDISAVGWDTGVSVRIVGHELMRQ